MALRGVLAGAAVALLVGLLGVAAAAADTTTTDTTTTSSTTTTEATTTEAATTEAATTTPATTTTTTSAATSATTTAPPARTSTGATTVAAPRPRPRSTTTRARALVTHPRPSRRRHVARRHRAHRPAVHCRIQAAALLIPGRRPRVLARIGGAAPHGPHMSAGHARCGRAGARLRSVSLLGGAVAAARVALVPGARTSASAAGLVVSGRPVAPAGQRRIALRRWGYVVAAIRAPVRVPGGRTAVAGLVVHLLRRHAGLPAGSTLAVAVRGLNLGRLVPRAHRRHAHRGHLPLRVTPPLGVSHYVFPVVGHVDYGDTYGGFRGDVPGNWHHGDDLFAPLGTPVVALAGGMIYRVGWERLGGWRLWLRDRAGNEYYYAHLSGYAIAQLRAQPVRAGQVLGFVGNTGDAFMTPPHLHFEIHPRRLLRLGYDGAVDPTTYLAGWARLRHVRAGRPVHPPLPREPLVRARARFVFDRLLAARGLVRHPRPAARGRVHAPLAAGARAHAPARHGVVGTSPARAGQALAMPLVMGLGFVALCATLLLVPPVRRRARHALAPADADGDR